MKKLIIFLFFLGLIISFTFADPLEPITVKGFIKFSDGTGVPNGWLVNINDTTSNSFTTTEVYAPPIPQLAGAYSAVILGNIGDLIRVWVNNETHYGETIVISSSNPEEINVTINNTRGSEANVSIFFPSNNYVTNTSDNLTINYSVIILGGVDGTNCDAEINISNSVFAPKSNSFLGALSRGIKYNFSFELLPTNLGTTNISINLSCDSDTIYFENLFKDQINNISVYDNSPPEINLISPENEVINTTDTNITFFFNVSDDSGVINCSLYLNGISNVTLSSITRNVTLNISTVLTNNVWNWSVACYDSNKNFGVSLNRTLTINMNPSEIFNILIDNPIMLNPGINTSINMTLLTRDDNGNADINGTNLTFYFKGNSPNPNYFYANSSCSEISASGIYKNYSCSFDLTYFAVNGTWNATAYVKDVYGNVLDYTVNTTILPLYSFDAPSVIDYGGVAVGRESNERITNITNVGNMNFSLYVWTYGGFDNSTGYNKSFICSGNNMSTSDHRFSSVSSTYDSKTPLDYKITDSGIDILKQTQSGINAITPIYWQVKVPVLFPGINDSTCNGTVVLEAFN